MTHKGETKESRSDGILVDPKAPFSSTTPGEVEKRLVTLYAIGQQLMEHREPSQVFETIRQAVMQHLNPDAACILRTGASGELHPIISYKLDLGVPRKEWPVSRTVLEKVRESGMALLSMDTLSDHDLRESRSVKKLKIRSILCAPLGSNPVRGLVYVSRGRRKGPFERKDLEFLTAIAVYATLTLDRAVEHVQTTEALRDKSERLAFLQKELLRHQIIGRDPGLLKAYDAVRRFARAGARVLIRGETGTGKELFARAYAAAGDRSERAFVPVPIPAMPPGLVESELFGHTKGAFTSATGDRKGRLELADGGVLFLDEVGDIPLELQPKLLRFLDSGEVYRVGENRSRHVDTLVVSATNRPLEALVQKGRFREDLLARLGHVVNIPPLRERVEDIPLLIEHFLEMYDRNKEKAFAPETLDLWKRSRWELNVRQLQLAVERAVCLVDEDVITPGDVTELVASSHDVDGADRFPPLKDVVKEVERKHILRALEITRGNRKEAIALLQLSAEKFYNRLKEYGISKNKS
jgi:transcriptional regulator with GAF, ATPase, and Fis domain